MKVLLIIVAFLIVNLAFSQNVEFKKKNFESPEKYTEAKEALDKANTYFFAGEFDKALRPFKNAQSLNPNNALVNFKIGVCYLKNDDLQESLPYFKKAQELDPKVDPKISFALGQSYQANSKYQEAIDSYNLYLAGLSKKEGLSETDKVQKYLDICQAELQKIESEKIVLAEAADLEAKKSMEQEAEKAKEPEVKEMQEPEEQKKTEPLVKETKPEEVLIETKPVVVAKSSPETVIYRIQILSASKPVSAADIKKVYTGQLKVDEIKVGSSYKYYIGNYKSREEVSKAISKANVKGAFPVRFKNGKRI